MRAAALALLQGGGADAGSVAADLQAQAAAFGLALPAADLTERAHQADCSVWPEHWPAVQTFALCALQLRTGPGGAIGLDYGVLMAVMDRLRIKRRHQVTALAQIGVMEDELLAHLRPLH